MKSSILFKFIKVKKEEKSQILSPEEYLKKLEELIVKTNKVLNAETKNAKLVKMEELVELGDQFKSVFLEYPHLAYGERGLNKEGSSFDKELEFLIAYKCYKNLVARSNIQEPTQVQVQEQRHSSSPKI